MNNYFLQLKESLLILKALRYSDKDATTISKHCHHQDHVNYTDNFKIMGSSVNNYFLQLKESLLILKALGYSDKDAPAIR